MSRVLPASRNGRIGLGVVVVVLIALALIANHYFNNVPDNLADDYREDAEKAADTMTDGMDRTYARFDDYLAASTVPKKYLDNADDVAELRRRILPVLDDTDDVLKRADQSIAAARKDLKASQKKLADTPSSWMLDDSEQLQEVDKVARRSDAYVKQSMSFLKNFERFVRYDKNLIDLTRRSYAPRPIDELPADAPLEEIEATVAAEKEFNAKLREDLLDLTPPEDAEKLHDQTVEELNVVVDYFEDVETGIQNLDVAALEQADADFLATLRELDDKSVKVVAEFALNSDLQKDSRALGKQADQLEKAVASLGTGDGEPGKGDIPRLPLPKPAPDDGGGSDDGATQQS